MASIGGGYVWPRLILWGEGEQVGLQSRSDPAGVVGPVRYVTDTLPLFVPGSDFEKAVDEFLELAVHERFGFGSDRTALKAQWNALLTERRDAQFAEWRRLEAQLGFDPDSAPEALLAALVELAGLYGEESIEEAVQAHPGLDAANVLNREIAVTQESGWDCDFSEGVQAAGAIDRHGMQAPWQMAEEVGNRVRRALGIHSGPMENGELASLAKISQRALDSSVRSEIELDYGLRLRDPDGFRNRLAFQWQWPTSRRFDLGRAIG